MSGRSEGTQSGVEREEPRGVSCSNCGSESRRVVREKTAPHPISSTDFDPLVYTGIEVEWEWKAIKGSFGEIVTWVKRRGEEYRRKRENVRDTKEREKERERDKKETELKRENERDKEERKKGKGERERGIIKGSEKGKRKRRGKRKREQG